MFFKKPAHKSTTRLVGLDLQSAANILRNSNKEFTAEELKQIEDYVAERVKHLKQLRQQAAKK